MVVLCLWRLLVILDVFVVGTGPGPAVIVAAIVAVVAIV